MYFQFLGLQFHREYGYGITICSVEMFDVEFEGSLFEIFYDGTWEIDVFFIKGFLKLLGKLW